MKRLISLLLTAVLTLSLLLSVGSAAENRLPPPQIHPELADVKVTCSGDETVEYYFEDLTQDIIDYTCKTLPGEKVITLLQDTELFTLSTSSQFLSIPESTARWFGGAASSAVEQPLVIDLGGNTLSFFGAANLFYLQRYGFTLRNGTVLYTNTAGEGRSPFCFGQSTGATATNSGKTSHKPKLILENVHVYNLTPGNGPIIRSYLYDASVRMTNCVLWASGTANAVTFSKTSQKNVENPWNGPYQPSLYVKNSVIGSDRGYFLGTKVQGAKATLEDSIVVSGNAGEMVSSSCAAEITQSGTPDFSILWSMTLRDGRSVGGTAYTVGTAPNTLPFADVQQSDWFYPFVSQLYSRKIVAGQTATAFNPDGKLTYAAALKLLVVGLTGNDVGNALFGHWARGYHAAAKRAGWTDIDEAKLDTPITREAFCEIAAKAKNLTKQPAANKFTDTKNPAVLALVEAGVINGMTETTFAPGSVLTRAQISKIISLLLEK